MTKKTTSLLAAAVVGVAAIVIAAIGGVFDSSDDSRLLVTADELADLQATGDVVVVDARDPEDYAAGAIPGAASLHTETLNQTITLEDGTEVPRLVKDADDIARPLRAAGIRENRPVVVYDNGAETSATRVFWVLDYYGHDDVRVLDGGVAAW
ncbi:MAG: rhodanese-like domain-containing protein, partial [Nitriliruptoraceae bacterium]